jgi:hypothetical protein
MQGSGNLPVSRCYDENTLAILGESKLSGIERAPAYAREAAAVEMSEQPIEVPP